MLLLLAGLTLWLERTSQPQTVASGKTRHDPDYIVNNFTITRFDANGKLYQTLTAKEMRHYPDDNSLAFVRPKVLTLDENEPAFEVTADDGVGPDDGTKIDLSGHVVMIREETPESARLEARTDQATVYINEKVIQTARPVQIDLGPNRLDGTGMRLDGQTRELRVDSRVRGTLAPDVGRP